jgi:DNA-binding NarL/FixJ family response regulator
MAQLPNGNGESGTAALDESGPDNLAERRRMIRFVTPAGTIADSLVRALEHEFPWLSVELIDRPDAAGSSSKHPVSLIFIDNTLIRAVEQGLPELKRLHPEALIGVVQRDNASPKLSADIFDVPLINGVLPMNLRLDIWLSVIRLMLCGGEYFPPDLHIRYASRGGEAHVASWYTKPNGYLPSAHIAELTAREIQILEMVSRGLQNKTIAAEFRLSEHTVKVHLHNIISKLGTHNRTEAAAKFRRFQDGMNQLSRND